MSVTYEEAKEALLSMTDVERQITSIFYLKDIKDRLDTLLAKIEEAQ